MAKKYINLKNKPTEWLREVLNDPYCRDVRGRDFEERKEEMQEIVWRREEAELERQTNQLGEEDCD